MSQIDPGTMLGGRYSLTRLLTAAGAERQRWAATDGTLKRDVTVVTFPHDDAHAGAALDGARRVASTVDQRLARVLDVGEQDGTAFIVVESLEHAQTLTQLAQGGGVHPEEARRVIGEAASALESARLRGLHHQLLTPSQLRVSKDGSVSVSGVATAAALTGLDETSPADASRADTLGLVACLYAALTGTWPLTGGNFTGLPAAPRHQDGSLKTPAEISANVPHDLDDLCHDTLPLEDGDDPQADAAYAGPRSPGDVARGLAPWSADPITPDVAHLDHVAAPVFAEGGGRAGQQAETWGDEDSWDDDGWDDSLVYPAAAEDGYDYDEYEEEPARRLPAATPPPRRTRSQTGVTLALVAGFVLVAVFLTWLGLTTMAQNPWDSPSSAAKSSSPTRPDGPLPVPTTAAPSPTSTSAPAGQPIKPSSATLVNAGVDGQTYPVSNVIDGKTDTYWTTMGWQRQDRSDEPVGIVLDLGGEKEVRSVDVTFTAGTYAPTVYVGASPGTSGATQIGASTSASGTFTATAKEPAKGRYVILWFTQAGQPNRPVVAGYPYAVQISEVKVSG